MQKVVQQTWWGRIGGAVFVAILVTIDLALWVVPIVGIPLYWILGPVGGGYRTVGAVVLAAVAAWGIIREKAKTL